MIIAFEGGEGTGKGTQIDLLQETLKLRGYKVLSIIEPEGTATGQAIREVLLNRADLNILGITEVFLFSASRAQQVKEVVIPALEKGYIILSDRSFFSTFAYQGYGRGIDLKLISELTSIAVGDVRPDMVILLDIAPELGLARKNRQGRINRLDAEKLSFHRMVREGYLELADMYRDTWFVADATLPIDQLHRLIMVHVLDKIEK